MNQPTGSITNCNFMQTTGGHCFICHEDWEGNSHLCDVCDGTTTPCTDRCSKRYTQSSDRYNYCPHCGHKL